MIKKNIKQHNLVEPIFSSLGLLESLTTSVTTVRIHRGREAYRPGRSFTFITGSDGAMMLQSYLGDGAVIPIKRPEILSASTSTISIL